MAKQLLGFTVNDDCEDRAGRILGYDIDKNTVIVEDALTKEQHTVGVKMDDREELRDVGFDGYYSKYHVNCIYGVDIGGNLVVKYFEY